MKTEDNYRIKIKEWQEITEIYCVPTKHIEYVVQKRYNAKNWFERIFLKDDDTWYTQSCHKDENEAILEMRNLYYRENPKTTYYNF